MGERTSLAEIYPPEIVEAFPTFEKAVSEFLEHYAGSVATLKTTPEDTARYAQSLQDLARIIAKGINQRKIDFTQLYWKVTKPAKEAGEIKGPLDTTQVGMIFGEHYYHILEKAPMRGNEPDFARSLLILLQRVPHKIDTGSEVHGVIKIKEDDPPELVAQAKGGLVPAQWGGIEVYLPLTDGIEFHVNDQTFKPKALVGLVTVLPGDKHHHTRVSEEKRLYGPARVVIFGAFGFSRAPKTEENFQVDAFREIPRYTQLNVDE